VLFGTMLNSSAMLIVLLHLDSRYPSMKTLSNELTRVHSEHIARSRSIRSLRLRSGRGRLKVMRIILHPSKKPRTWQRRVRVHNQEADPGEDRPSSHVQLTPIPRGHAQNQKFLNLLVERNSRKTNGLELSNHKPSCRHRLLRFQNNLPCRQDDPEVPQLDPRWALLR
jgi:hypothetical protein